MKRENTRWGRTLALLPAAVLLLVSACTEPIPTTEFEALKTKICACTDAACAGALATDLQALKTRGGAPVDTEQAKALLTDATACAAKLDPEIGKKIRDALKK